MLTEHLFSVRCGLDTGAQVGGFFRLRHITDWFLGSVRLRLFWLSLINYGTHRLASFFVSSRKIQALSRRRTQQLKDRRLSPCGAFHGKHPQDPGGPTLPGDQTVPGPGRRSVPVRANKGCPASQETLPINLKHCGFKEERKQIISGRKGGGGEIRRASHKR